MSSARSRSSQRSLRWRQLAPPGGGPLFRAVGTLVEPYDAPATFTGVVTVDGATSRYENSPLDAFFTEEAFFGAVCRGAKA